MPDSRLIRYEAYTYTLRQKGSNGVQRPGLIVCIAIERRCVVPRSLRSPVASGASERGRGPRRIQGPSPQKRSSRIPKRPPGSYRSPGAVYVYLQYQLGWKTIPEVEINRSIHRHLQEAASCKTSSHRNSWVAHLRRELKSEWIDARVTVRYVHARRTVRSNNAFRTTQTIVRDCAS